MQMYMYHENCRQGRVVEVSAKEGLLEQGWVTSPGKLTTIPPVVVKPTDQNIKNATPGEMVKLVEDLGYKVFTSVDLKQLEAKTLESATAMYNEKAQDLVETVKQLQSKLRAQGTYIEELQAHAAALEAENKALKNPGADALKNTPVPTEVSTTSETVDGTADDADESKAGQDYDEAYMEGLFERFTEKNTSLTREELVELGTGYGLRLKMSMKEATMIGHIINKMKSD